jgi:hypothetical protein
LKQSPPLSFTEWTYFHNFDNITHVAFVLLIMRHEFGRPFDKLPVERMFHRALCEDDDSFITFVAYYFTYPFFSAVSQHCDLLIFWGFYGVFCRFEPSNKSPTVLDAHRIFNRRDGVGKSQLF